MCVDSGYSFEIVHNFRKFGKQKFSGLNNTIKNDQGIKETPSALMDSMLMAITIADV